jgi:diguanylate cyclase (GGDEF)-like protein
MWLKALGRFIAIAQELEKELDNAQSSRLSLVLNSFLHETEILLIEGRSDPNSGEMVGELMRAVAEAEAEALELARRRTEEIRRRVTAEHKLTVAQERANIDETTGLPNEKGFRRDFYRKLRTRREQEQVWILAYMDLRSFKWWNETYVAHAVGTAVVEILASFLKRHVRRGQTEIARHHKGGDEFILLSTLQVEEGNGAMAGAESLIRRVASTLDRVDWEFQLRTFLRNRQQEHLLNGKPAIRPVHIDIGAVVWEIPEQLGRENVEPVADKLLNAADREMFLGKREAKKIIASRKSFNQSSYRIVKYIWNFKSEQFERETDRSRGLVTNLPPKIQKR